MEKRKDAFENSEKINNIKKKLNELSKTLNTTEADCEGRNIDQMLEAF